MKDNAISLNLLNESGNLVAKKMAIRIIAGLWNMLYPLLHTETYFQIIL